MVFLFVFLMHLSSGPVFSTPAMAQDDTSEYDIPPPPPPPPSYVPDDEDEGPVSPAGRPKPAFVPANQNRDDRDRQDRNNQRQQRPAPGSFRPARRPPAPHVSGPSKFGKAKDKVQFHVVPGEYWVKGQKRPRGENTDN